MKLDNWEAISSLLQAGGTFQKGRYELRNNHGLFHRNDGPAVIYPDGTQHWYRNGQFHRDDGPAITYQDGAQFWYLNGKRFGEDENEDPDEYFL